MKPLVLLRALVHDLADLVAPHHCIACGDPFPSRAPWCAACVALLEPPLDPIPGIVARFEHGGPVARALYHAKYDDAPETAEALGALLGETVREADLSIDRVVPVPLHPRRLAERGYNQAYSIASAVAKALGRPCDPDLLVRVRETSTQTVRDQKAREDNVRGAFGLRRGVRVAGLSLLVVDDVTTTGSTLREAMKVFTDAGARAVTGAAVSTASKREAW